MEVRILQMIEGARAARGLAVIIDVFRAFTVEAYLSQNGAAKICPVGDSKIAYDYKETHPDAVLVGERHGVMLPGFDFGNSPSQIRPVDLSGRTVLHTTSAGTQGIANASGAEEIITGSLVNAAAIARYIKEKDPEVVSLVCMGLEGTAPIEEDTLCAEYIRCLLTGEPVDLEAGIADLKVTSGAKFFDPAQQAVFPEEDFHLSTQVDQFDFVLRLVRSADGLDYVERVDV